MPSDSLWYSKASPGLPSRWWRDRLLLSALLVLGLIALYQAVLILVQPPWRVSANNWFLTLLAWLDLLGVVLFSWWVTRTRRPYARTWWLLSGALLYNAIAESLWVLGDEFLFPHQIPFPWWSDPFFLLQFPFLFLALAFLPSVPGRSSRQGLAYLRTLLDSLLVMGAAAAFSWYFFLAPSYLHRHESVLGMLTNLAYPVADLGVLLMLVVLFTRKMHFQAAREMVGVLIVALLCLIIGDSWYAALNLAGHYQAGDPPDLFWIVCYLLFPLAALVQFRLLRREAVPPAERQEGQAAARLQRQDLLGSLRFLSPFGAVLLASIAIEARLMLAPIPALGVLLPHLVILTLLLLVLIRQGVAFLEHAHVQRERQAAQAGELALRETNRQMDTFLGMASHELRTPLTSMLLHQQMMQRHLRRLQSQEAWQSPTGDAAVRPLAQHLRGLEVQLTRQSRLINELLDVSRIHAGRLELHLESTDLRASVTAAVEEQREVWPERTIQLCLSAEGALLVHADPDRLAQVVTNYLTNALRYSPEDRPVEVGVQTRQQHACVWVRDQGPGLPPEEQRRIWERFHRAPGIAIQSGSGVGLGIGLHLSKTIIEQHGGQVGVQSAPGQGSTFWFTLPLTCPATKSEERAARNTACATHGPGLAGEARKHESTSGS